MRSIKIARDDVSLKLKNPISQKKKKNLKNPKSVGFGIQYRLSFLFFLFFMIGVVIFYYTILSWSCPSIKFLG